VYYTYQKTSKGPQSWIDYLQKITDLDIPSLSKFTIKEVHFTRPKKPATSKKDWVNLPHITIENVSGKTIHWYIWNKAVDRDLRIEEMMGKKQKEYSTNQGELEFIAKVMADIAEQGWV
jgi:hypothetical protein